MLHDVIGGYGYQLDFLIDIGLSLLAGFLIGAERESRGKPAGISTHCLVIGGTMMFTYISAQVDPNSTSRIAAQIVTGIGFLGAGMILKSESTERITNLTTAAAVWFAAANHTAASVVRLVIFAVDSLFNIIPAPRKPIPDTT